MQRTLATIAMMLLAPPLLILVAAHAGAFDRSPVFAYATLVVGWAFGIAALATSHWSVRVRVGVGVLYTLAALPLLPFVALVAVCSTGNCL